MATTGNPHVGNALTQNSSTIGGIAGSAWGPVGYGLGSAAGSLLGSAIGGDSYRSSNRALRKAYKYRNRYDAQRLKSMVDGAKAAGLHPLAALGMSPAPQPAQQQIMPGQNNLGSAVSQGIETAMDVSRVQSAQGHQKQLAALGLEEQQLRNDWLRQQMQHANIKMAAQMANSAPRPPTETPGMTGTLPGRLDLGEYHPGLKTGTTTSADDAQIRYGEVGEQLMGLINMGYDMVANTLHQDEVDTAVNWYLDNIKTMRPGYRPSYDGLQREQRQKIVNPHNRGRPKYKRTYSNWNPRYGTQRY